MSKSGLRFFWLAENRALLVLCKRFSSAPFSWQEPRVKHGAKYIIEIATLGGAYPECNRRASLAMTADVLRDTKLEVSFDEAGIDFAFDKKVM